MRDVKHAPLWPMLLLFVAYPYFRHTMPTAQQEPKEELQSLYLARAVTEHLSLRINDVVKEHGDLPTKLQIENDQFAPGAPGTALLSVPPLLAARVLTWIFGLEMHNTRALRYLRVVVSIIPTCIVMLAFFVFMIRRGVHAHAARFGVIAAAFCAPLWANAIGLHGAHLAALCLLSCIILLGNDEDWPSRASFVASGIFGGLAVLLSYGALPFALLLTVYAFTRARSPQLVLGYILPVFVAIVAMCAFHYMTTQTLFAVVERAGADGVQTTHFWGLHGPRLDGFGRLFFSNLGVLRFAPVLALLPFGLFFMVGRGDVGEATLLGIGIVLALLFASGAPADDAVIASPFIAHAILLGIWPLARMAEALGGVAGGPILAGVLACWSFLQAVVVLATHIYVPPSFANPLRDLAMQMWRDGVYAPGLGHGVGLTGDLAVAPMLVMAFAIACALSLGGSPMPEGSGARRVLSAIIFGGALFYWQLSWSPEPERRERYLETLAIERGKEAERKVPDARIVRQANRLDASAPGSVEAKLAAGHAATAFGDNATALERYRTLP